MNKPPNALALIAGYLSTIGACEDAGDPIPNGVLYTASMERGVGYEAHTVCVNILCNAGLITVKNNLLSLTPKGREKYVALEAIIVKHRTVVITTKEGAQA